MSAPVATPSTPYASDAVRRLDALPGAELERVFLRGETPDVETLVGWEFRGLNTGFWAPHSPIRKFVKGMYRDPCSGQAYGYNEPVVQNGLDGPWVAKPRDDAPKRFGFYWLGPVDARSRDNAYLHALILDYGRGRNSLLEPAKVLRDYLVRAEPGNDDLFLGKAYAALAGARVPVGFFILERHRATDWVRPS